MGFRSAAAALLVATVFAPTSATRAAAPARSAATARAATVWAVGDAYPSPAGRQLAALVRHAHPARFLYLGDVYETGTRADFAARYDPLYGALAARTLPTIGNHEYANRRIGYGPYWAAKRGAAMPSWTRRRIAGWEILMLNSQAPHGAGSAQLRWLRRTTRGPGTCRIALTHRPRFSSGGHGDQPDMEPLWRALRGHARLLLSGHDHDLQRLADQQGIRQIVAGAGGRANIPLPGDSALAVRFVDRTPPGAVRLRLSRGRARIDFVDARGRLLDRSRVRCRPLRA